MRGPILTALVLIGVAARLALPPLGYNFDFTSYQIVSQIVADGGNVYAETTRYNYGPLWFLTLGLIRAIASLAPYPETGFRYGIVLVLTIADLAIAAILNRRFGARAALLFFLNPLSIVITGYHNQFDNVAIAAGLGAMLLAETSARSGDRRRWIAALCLLGLSLTVKHIFFLLPLWLAFRARSWREALVCATLPVAIFVAGFLPFLATGREGILHNVFLYHSFANGFLFRGLPPPVPATLLFIAALAAVGYLLRRRPLFDSALAYLIALVVLSPAMANQYLAIPTAAIAVAMNPGYALYTLSSFVILLTNADGLHLGAMQRLLGPEVWPWISDRYSYDLPVCVLAVGLLWQVLRWREAEARTPR